MGLTLRLDTLPMTPVRNRAWLEVACDEYEQVAPTTAEVDIQLQTNATPGFTFTVTLPDGTVLPFTAISGTPDTSGTQYAIEGDNLGTYPNLLAVMRGNVRLAELYDITTIGVLRMRLRARQPGALTPVVTFDTPAPIATWLITEGTDGVYAPGYSAQLRLYLEETWHSGIYTALPVMDGYPDLDKWARWNVAGMLMPYLRKSIVNDWPAYGMATPMLARNIFKRYYHERWERYGDPAVDRLAVRSAVKYAWFAGYRNRDAELAATLGEVFRDDSGPTPFLTMRGSGTSHHEVSADQQHVLGWYRTTERVAGQFVKLKGTVFYDDGTTANAVVLTWDDAAHLQGTVALWPSGFKTLGLHLLQETKTAYKYQVELLNHSDTPIAQKHTFWLKPAEVSEVHLEFVNSLGVVESVRGIGAWENTLEDEREELIRARVLRNQTLPSISESDAVQVLHSVQPKMTIALGAVDRLEHFTRLDILFSPWLRIVDHASGRKLPVRIESDAHDVLRRGAGTAEHLHTMQLKLLLGDSETAWGDRALLPTVSTPVPDVPQTP